MNNMLEQHGATSPYDDGITNDVAAITMEFSKWNDVKTSLELNARKPKISQGQIWWTGVGKNVGSEINGKNERFSRPVLIYKK